MTEEEFNKLSLDKQNEYISKHPEEFGELKSNKTREYHKIEVPPGIRYISDWQGFHIPDKPHIMDKEIPGCGFTEYCLTNAENTVLCSPRKMLLQNKYDQHLHNGDKLFLVKTRYDIDLETDKDITKNKAGNNTDEFIEKEFIKKLDNNNKREYKNTYDLVVKQLGEYISYRQSVNKPIKILTTYDSFGIVKQALQYFKVFESFRIVIDEWQSIFTDSRFKSGTELTFVNQLHGIQKVCYLSATPMMLEYIDDLPEFKDLPYYELDWRTLDSTRIVKPNLTVRTVNSIITKGKEIIKSYLDGKFERFYFSNGSYRESKECVIYVNSVNNICSLIRGMNLRPEQINILVSNTLDNVAKIHKRVGKNFDIGEVPREDEINKMFTLCTRTVYLGADFYSDNARSFILSDANIETLAVDISLDLPQIMGRQRLNSNPWRNDAEFYYKPLTNGKREKLGDKDFQNFLQKKFDDTDNLLDAFNQVDGKGKYALAKRYKIDANTYNYKYDYIAVNRDSNGNLEPVRNELVIIAEKRAFDVQKYDYQDRFSVFNNIDSSLYSNEDSERLKSEMHQFYEQYGNIKNNTQLVLKLYCELDISKETKDRIYDLLPSKIKSYLSLGKEKLRSIKYIPEKIERLLNNETINIDDIIYSRYKIGDKLEKSNLKKNLQDIYDKSGLSKKAKATDIEEWFQYSDSCMRKDGKKINIIILKDRKK